MSDRVRKESESRLGFLVRATRWCQSWLHVKEKWCTDTEKSEVKFNLKYIEFKLKHVEQIVKLLGVFALIGGAVFGLVDFFAQRKSERDQRAIQILQPYLDVRLKLYHETIESAAKLATIDDPNSQEAEKEWAHFRQLSWARLSFVDDSEIDNSVWRFGHEFARWKEDPKMQDKDKLSTMAREIAYDCRDSLSKSFVSSLGLESRKWKALFPDYRSSDLDIHVSNKSKRPIFVVVNEGQGDNIDKMAAKGATSPQQGIIVNPGKDNVVYHGGDAGEEIRVDIWDVENNMLNRKYSRDWAPIKSAATKKRRHLDFDWDGRTLLTKCDPQSRFPPSLPTNKNENDGWKAALHSSNSRRGCSTMHVSLTPEIEQIVRQRIATERYASPDEVIQEAIKVLEERDCLREARLEELRKEIQIGIDQIERGEYTVYDENTLHAHFEQVEAEGRRRLAAEQARLPE